MPSPTELADMLYAIFDDIWSSDSIAVVILAAEKYDDNHVFNGLPKIWHDAIYLRVVKSWRGGQHDLAARTAQKLQ